MAGHLGSALMAGYFLGEIRSDLAPGVQHAIERDLERILNGEEAFWFDPKKKGITIDEMFAEGKKGGDEPIENATERIATAVEKNIDSARQSGHNVIFASIAIRGFEDHPEFSTAEFVTGCERLMGLFDKAHPGRGYYGEKIGWKTGNQIKPAELGEVPAYATLGEMAEATLDHLIATAGEHRQGYGGLVHFIDHAAALIELANHGFPALAKRGIPAHRQHLQLLRSLPVLNEELGQLVRADRDPLTPEYWSRRESVQWSAWLTHRIKSLYGFNVLAQTIEDEAKIASAEDAFRYLMA